ncbi:hypothetical protein LPLAFNJD_LOCUS3965 [Methylorubrum aminovorans]|nr:MULTISPECIES: hypothetical protein [unclassified Methylobacterium]QIJ75691.1 hypothetical protein CLZ_14420 [Methylobacterium sp. CLZ]QIJ80595.1 hypothetical protein GU700_14425 [Methylobacterium sp. NI91]
MVSAVSTSSAGVSAALQRFDGAAARGTSPRSATEPVTAVTELASASFGVSVNTAVLKSTIEAEKRVLDILV